MEAVIYLPQQLASSYNKGDTLELHVVANAQKLPVEVTRFGEQMETAPPTLARYYHSNESLLQLYARPHTGRHNAGEDGSLRLGSEIRLPRTWTGWSRGFANKKRMRSQSRTLVRQ